VKQFLSGGPKKSRLLTAMSLVAMATIGFLVGQRSIEARQDAKSDEKTRALVEGQVQISQKALKWIQNSRQIGAPVRASSEEWTTWSRRLLEAQIFLSLGDNEPKTQDVEVYLSQAHGPMVPGRVAFFEGHLDRMRLMEAWYRPMYEKTQMSAFDFTRVEFSRNQAEVWLSRERGRGERKD